jgi:hypothetical protein
MDATERRRERARSQATLDCCAFCGASDPSLAYGTARTYIHRTADDGSIDRSRSGVEEVTVCQQCALADEPDPEPAEHWATCDVCGTVTPRRYGKANGGTVRENVESWSVSIRGLDGVLLACRDCTPIRDHFQIPRSERRAG